MTNVPPLAQTIAAATRAQQVAKARGIAKKVVALLAAQPLFHGALPTAIDAQDWGPALDAGQCALWLLERDYRWLAAEEIALEWLRQMQLTDHGVWPELIPYPAEALARVKEAA
jgi:hypothetical protein